MKRVVVGLFIAACGAAQVPDGSGSIDVQDVFPMEEGGVWSYDIDTGFGPPVFGVFRVETIEGNRVDIRNNGDELSRYERRADGIFDLIQGVWHLRAPLEVGTEWEAAGGRTARIVSVADAVDVPAGHYESCVTVSEGGGEDRRTLRTTYCPDVGMVLQEASISLELSDREAAVTVKLRGYLAGGI